MTVDLANLRIVHYPDEVLQRRASPVEGVTEEVRAVARRMIDLMHEAEGIGLAAPQVGLSWRLFVCEVPPSDDRSLEADPIEATARPRVYINPELFDPIREIQPFDEGCLSLPGITGEVFRPEEISIRALGLDGEPFEERASGLLARCWQHEFDHLDGVLILNRMTHRSRMRNRGAIRAMERGELR
ncbi:MAG: peptide deformylase [Phycisphaerales bacterium]|nr:peptide deformylase [Phycisphaerales bacterium]